MWVRVVLSGGKWSKVGESMLTGEYRHSIDEKGRLIIPAKYRDILGDNFVVTKGLDSCLFIYPNDEWTSFENKLRGLPLTNQNARHFSRFFLAGAVSCDTDKQGRILVPQNLREFAKLEKEVVLVGVSSRVEIWSKENWETYINEESLDMDNIANNMADLGI